MEKPVTVPTTLIHGTRDELLDLAEVRNLAETAFSSLTVMVVDDDHRLHHTAEILDWKHLLE